MKEETHNNKQHQDRELPDSILEAIVGGAGKGDNQDPPTK